VVLDFFFYYTLCQSEQSNDAHVQVLVDCDAKIRDADAFIIVTAEYNHSVPPALSNLLDHFGSSAYSYKPSGIICYSPGKMDE
jgi:NAD(P)H-dependent FMN reductase